MGIIFNRITFLVIISIIVIFSLSMNEVVKFVQRAQGHKIAQYAQWLNTQQTRFNTQEACQKTTYQICELKQCEYRPADDGSVTETCSTAIPKQWSPTNISIPSPYQQASLLTLTMVTPTLRHEFSIQMPQSLLTYTLQAPDGRAPIIQTKTIAADEILHALNTVLLYDLSAGIDSYPQPEGETSYTIKIVGSSAEGSVCRRSVDMV